MTDERRLTSSKISVSGVRVSRWGTKKTGYVGFHGPVRKYGLEICRQWQLKVLWEVMGNLIRKSGKDSALQKTSEYEVKVQFAREFADVESIGYTVPESLSSSSSFQSLSSTRSTKSSSGICSDSVPQSLDQISDTSYLNSSIPGVDELILGCARIELTSEQDSINCTQAQVVVEDFQAQVVVEDFQAQVVVEDSQDQTESIALNFIPYSVTDSVSSVSAFAEHTEDLSFPSISTLPSLQLTDSSRLCENEIHVNDPNVPVTEISKNLLNSLAQETDDKSGSQPESCTNLILLSETSSTIPRTTERAEERLEANAPAETEDDRNTKDVKPVTLINSRSIEVEAILVNTDATESLKETEDEKGEKSSEEKLVRTSTSKDELLKPENVLEEAVPEEERYTDFKPQRQSTSLGLPNVEQPNFDELKSSAEQVPNDIFESTIVFPEESDCFTTATSDIFQDPTSFDFLIAHGNSKCRNGLRAESLYVKFDPLVGDTTDMLLEENTDPINEEEQNGKTAGQPPNIITPRRNPAIAAIDRLLFYSPITTNMTPKMEEPNEKIEQAADEPKSDTLSINFVNMTKELELVRETVLQLEEELEKQEKEHKTELERQKNSFEEKITQLQAQLAQEVKSKSEITIVVEEYEKSISRLLTEKGRDQEKLQATNVHLSNTEAAFNDVHQKYEKMKSVVSVYTNNEKVLRESIQENMQTIKCLHTRYDNLKAHASSQLEKANSDLENIRKQHEGEIVSLHALVRKAELKSNSLSELVEQKTKENKELVQILDEVIARIGHPNTE